MHKAVLAGAIGAFGLVIVGACATAAVVTDPGTDDGGINNGNDTGVVDAGCPQFDINSDPKHCGSCTKACTDLQVCSGGQCKAACDAPLVKCAGDAGAVGCTDLTKDTAHCGSCNTACTGPDAGSLTPGTNNPDPGIFGDAGYDGGIGWTVGTPSCDKSTCGVGCTNGFTACSDKICYDTQNHHDNCGACGTACAAMTEWCTGAKCCPVGQANCGGTCTDVMNDDMNCGGCGKPCPMNQHCSSGTCSACGGYQALGGCWYTSAQGASCNATCASHGGFDPVAAKHSGNQICTHFFPQKANGSNWMTEECCSTDNNTNWGATGANPDPTWTFGACFLACACKN